MKLEEKIARQVLAFSVFFKARTDSFIKLPILVKLFLSPIILLIFFTSIFPLLIVLGSLYKVITMN